MDPLKSLDCELENSLSTAFPRKVPRSRQAKSEWEENGCEQKRMTVNEKQMGSAERLTKTHL